MQVLDIKLEANSHDPQMKMIVKNLPAGLVINHQLIVDNLKKRRPSAKYNTNRIEQDEYELSGGIVNNMTTGEPLIITVFNKNINSTHYPKGMIRPGHADYVGYEFVDKFDHRGGGCFSGRITALYVILGAIVSSYLDETIVGKISQVGVYQDTPLARLSDEQVNQIDNELLIYDPNIYNQVVKLIENYRQEGDSIGAQVEVRITNPTGGLGGIDFDNFEGQLAQALFSIGAIKGINFGLGQDFVTTPGSISCDQLSIDHNKVTSHHHYQGGINGGIVNGYEPITFNCIIKAPCSVFKPIKTIMKTNHGYENTTLQLKGRHDSFIANRVLVVIISMCQIVLFDQYLFHNKLSQK